MNASSKKILVSGSSGFVGKHLVEQLSLAGHQVFALVRRPAKSKNEVSFLNQADDLSAFEGFDLVIHLAGENVAQGLWTRTKKDRIRSSRINYTQKIVEIIKKLKHPPAHFISASAIGIYGNRGNEMLTENSALGTGFLAQVCKDWELASRPLQDLGIKTTWLRIGLVLGSDGGLLKTLKLIFTCGLGGKIGSGKQIMSWISIDDLVNAIIFIINHQHSGVFNMTSPNPVSNYKFTKILATILHRPAFFAVPAFFLRLLPGNFANETLLSSTKVVPERLVELGFDFKHKTLPEALQFAYDHYYSS